MIHNAVEKSDPKALEEINALREELTEKLALYESTLQSHGIRLPYSG